MKSLLWAMLLTPSVRIDLTPQEAEAYGRLEAALLQGLSIEGEFRGALTRPRFLRFLAGRGKYVFHGSNRHDIGVLEPREMTLWSGEQARAVFASPDPDWAVFYAVFRRASLVGSFRNGCIAGRRTRYHYYSLNGSTMNNRPWTDGALYVLPQERFVRPAGAAIPFEEWICREPVAPLGKLGVAPDDFLYRSKVAVHPDGEPLVRTWLLYKLRACSIRCKR